MIAKTFAGVLGGGLVSISVMLNLNFILPFNVDLLLLVGLLVSFPIWIVAMVWCYGASGGLQAWKRCAYVLAFSVSVNSFFILG
jgi:hypothetical protein